MEKRYIKKEKAIIILILIVVISFLITYFVYDSFKPVEIKTIDMDLTVGNYTGFDVNTSALIFGTTVPNSYVKRTINITNIDENNHKVSIKAYGELKEWTSISEDSFTLKGDETKEIDVEIRVPTDADRREYTGDLKILFR